MPCVTTGYVTPWWFGTTLESIDIEIFSIRPGGSGILRKHREGEPNMFSHTITRAGRRAVFAVLPLAVAASLVTTGTAAADVTVARQAEIAAGLAGEGVTDGVGYKTTVSPDLRTISATVDNGRFVLSADSTNVAVISDTGAKVSELPLTLAT